MVTSTYAHGCMCIQLGALGTGTAPAFQDGRRGAAFLFCWTDTGCSDPSHTCSKRLAFPRRAQNNANAGWLLRLSGSKWSPRRRMHARGPPARWQMEPEEARALRLAPA